MVAVIAAVLIGWSGAAVVVGLLVGGMIRLRDQGGPQ